VQTTAQRRGTLAVAMTAPRPLRLEPAPTTHFVFDEQTVLAVNTALASGRPLLVSGPPGSGKSSLGPAIAESLNLRHYSVAGRASLRMQDLLYRLDEERRLRDAQMPNRLLSAGDYLEPGILWWAFDADSASHPGSSTSTAGPRHPDPGPPDRSRSGPAVVTIDDIDQADPDLGLDVLQVLQAGRFVVSPDGRVVQAHPNPLVILTSGGTRALPAALTRACVRLDIPRPDEEKLVTIAKAHGLAAHGTLLRQLAARFQMHAAERVHRGGVPLSTADFLDIVRAVTALGLKPGDEGTARVFRSIVGGDFDEPAATRPSVDAAAPSMREAVEPGAGNVSAFVCYARADQDFVLALAESVRRRVPDLWLDQWSIPPGADWDAAIDTAIKRCQRFLIFLSPRSVASPEVQSELRQALNLGKQIIPVLLEPCDVPRRLNLLQYIEVRHRPAGDASLIDSLLRALRPDPPGAAVLTPLPDTPAPPPPPAAPPRPA
jgi:MoxR-like ATPase